MPGRDERVQADSRELSGAGGKRGRKKNTMAQGAEMTTRAGQEVIQARDTQNACHHVPCLASSQCSFCQFIPELAALCLLASAAISSMSGNGGLEVTDDLRGTGEDISPGGTRKFLIERKIRNFV